MFKNSQKAISYQLRREENGVLTVDFCGGVGERSKIKIVLIFGVMFLTIVFSVNSYAQTFLGFPSDIRRQEQLQEEREWQRQYAIWRKQVKKAAEELEQKDKEQKRSPFITGEIIQVLNDNIVLVCADTFARTNVAIFMDSSRGYADGDKISAKLIPSGKVVSVKVSNGSLSSVRMFYAVYVSSPMDNSKYILQTKTINALNGVENKPTKKASIIPRFRTDEFSFTTKDGATTYNLVTEFEIHPSFVFIYHEHGGSREPLANLPDNVLARLKAK